MKRTSRDGLFFGALPLAFAASPAGAQLIIGAEARVQAASNPLLLTGGDKDAIMGEISVKPEFKTESATGNSLDLAGVVTERHYSRLYRNYVLGSAIATGELRHNERFSVKASAGYLRDLAGDDLARSVDGVISPQSVRNSWTGDVSATWRPNALTMILPAISVERTTFDNSANLQGERFLQNTDSATFEIGFRHRFTVNTWIGIRPVADYSRTRTQPSLHRLALFGTLNKNLSSKTTLEIDAGVEHIDGAGATSQIPARSPAYFFSGSFSLCRTGETTSGCITASMGSEVSALFGFQRRKAAGVNISKRINERWTVTGEVSYQRISSPANVVRLRDADAVSARAALDWRLSQTATLSGELQYMRRRIESGEAPHSGYVGLRFRWQPRLR